MKEIIILAHGIMMDVYIIPHHIGCVENFNNRGYEVMTSETNKTIIRQRLVYNKTRSSRQFLTPDQLNCKKTKLPLNVPDFSPTSECKTRNMHTFIL